MTFLLSTQNVTEYIAKQSLCTQAEQAQAKVEPRGGKNFNLLLTLPGDRKLLIKQERFDLDGKTVGEFWHEWRIYQIFQQFPELSHLRPWLTEVLHFEAENSIIVFQYLDNYHDLMSFYLKENTFPIAISTAIGKLLASIHRLTLNRQDYQDFMKSVAPNQAAYLYGDLERIEPEVFGEVPPDGLKFFALYQRYDSLGKAIAELGDTFEPCCLTHNDLKLNNILLLKEWEHQVAQADTTRSQAQPRNEGEAEPGNEEDRIIRLIDWERAAWGDPASDLGMAIGSYLQIWLHSLVTSNSMAIEESLRLATTPLEFVQPAIAALTSAYLQNFPEILEHRPDFLKRVVQFSGMALIRAIQAKLQYQKSFGNTGICMLQVAKSLLCRPESSIRTVFGIQESQLIAPLAVDG